MRHWNTAALLFTLPLACAGHDERSAAGGARGVVRAEAPPAGWRLPIGVPMPEFGILEQAGAPTLVVGEGESLPRPIPAGAVIEIRGTYAREHTSPHGVLCAGTAERPAVIRGAEGAVVTGSWEISGTYCILEHLKFSGPGWTFLAPGHHLVLRGSEVTGTLKSGGWGIQTWGAGDLTDVLILGSKIHDNGNWQANYDQDVHGIGVYRAALATGTVANVWILENEFWHNSGDGVQVNGHNSGQAMLHHVYMGRNVAHHNKQNGFWTKQASDVIFSENLAYAHRPSDSSPGAGMGYQYGAERVWFLFNHIHDCDFGITAMSDWGTNDGVESYYVGNVIHDIHAHGEFNPNTGWGNAGLMLAGGQSRTVVNNTIHDVDGGINCPGGGSLFLANNIVSGLSARGGAHLFIESPGTAAASTVTNTLLQGAVRVKWGASSPVLGLDAFRSTFAGRCKGCINADPQLGDPASEDLRPRPQSAAVDAGVAVPVYTAFRERYHLDIARDADAKERPQGKGWDLGAYEAPGEAPPAVRPGPRP